MVSTRRAADLAPGAEPINVTNLTASLLAEDWTKALGFAPYAGSAVGLLESAPNGRTRRSRAAPDARDTSPPRAIFCRRSNGTAERAYPVWPRCTGRSATRGVALALTEQSYEVRNPEVVWIGTWVGLDPLRGEPRFDAIVEKLGLPNGGPGYQRSRQ